MEQVWLLLIVAIYRDAILKVAKMVATTTAMMVSWLGEHQL